MGCEGDPIPEAAWRLMMPAQLLGVTKPEVPKNEVQ